MRQSNLKVNITNDEISFVITNPELADYKKTIKAIKTILKSFKKMTKENKYETKISQK